MGSRAMSKDVCAVNTSSRMEGDEVRRSSIPSPYPRGTPDCPLLIGNPKRLCGYSLSYCLLLNFLLSTYCVPSTMPGA